MYVLCFVLVMVVPVVMLGTGLKWKLRPPAFKTGTLVYRTAWTEKSPEVWDFAHSHFAKLWTRYGAILGVVSAALMVVFDGSYQKFLLWLLCGQMLLFCITILMMEMLIKNLYDENGERIQGT